MYAQYAVIFMILKMAIQIMALHRELLSPMFRQHGFARYVALTKASSKNNKKLEKYAIRFISSRMAFFFMVSRQAQDFYAQAMALDPRAFYPKGR